MKGFKAFLAERKALDEGIVKKGAVAAFALQGRNHGNNAVRSYNKAKQTLRAVANAKSTDNKVDALTRAFIDLLARAITERDYVNYVIVRIINAVMVVILFNMNP